MDSTKGESCTYISQDILSLCFVLKFLFGLIFHSRDYCGCSGPCERASGRGNWMCHCCRIHSIQRYASGFCREPYRYLLLLVGNG